VREEVQQSGGFTLTQRCRTLSPSEAACTPIFTASAYIGNTQGNAKVRLMTHLSEMKRLAYGGKKSDSFAAHFVGHI